MTFGIGSSLGFRSGFGVFWELAEETSVFVFCVQHYRLVGS